jgi:hypothetical protein
MDEDQGSRIEGAGIRNQESGRKATGVRGVVAVHAL